MSLQLSLFRAPRARLDYWRGYSWGEGPAQVVERARGVVTLPRWAKRAAAGGAPIMLDNGAYPAFRDGVTLSGAEMFERQAEIIEAYGEQVEWAIAPDIVAGGRASLARSLLYAPRLAALGPRVLLPIQEGFDLAEVVGLMEPGWGAFIGGRAYSWKIETARQLRGLDASLHIHIGRIWKAGHVEQVAGIADSFDNTTYVRRQTRNTTYPEVMAFEEVIAPMLRSPR